MVTTFAQAAPISVVNSGFEDITGETPYNEFTFGSLPGWTYYDPSGTKGAGAGGTYFIGTLQPTIIPARDPVNYQFFPDGAYAGTRMGIAFNFTGSGGTGEYGLQQTLSESLQPFTTYTLTVRIGNIALGYAVDNTFYNLNGFPGYRVDLMAGSTVLSSDSTSAGVIPEGQWGLSTLVFSTGAAETLASGNLGIRLVNLNVIDPLAPSADLEVDFDAVQLDASPIPEPSIAALILLAALGGLAWKSAKRRPTNVAL
jgi:hapalindole H/12-epi-hapalindole U/12-epi-fischerindole U synthase